MTESVAKTFADLTTMRVGGAPDALLTVQSRAELIEVVLDLQASGEPWLPLGGGSNTIVSDEGFPGTVVLIRTKGVTVIADTQLQSNQVRIRVEAGHNWDDLVQFTVDNGWSGIEALSGIPGAAGAAPIQNIGAYGTELQDVLHSIQLLEEYSGEVIEVPAADLEFGYRDSALKRLELEGVVVTIDLVLTRGSTSDASAEVKFEQLARALGVDVGTQVSIQSIRDQVLKLRASKGMVLDEGDTDTWSSGSFFMNPVVPESFARGLPADAPRFAVGSEDQEDRVFALEDAHLVDLVQPAAVSESQVKLSAAWLIENAGISKGFRIPGSGAQISTKHTLAITNAGAATAEQVAELARYVMARVRSEHGILLVPEPNLYGLML